MPAGLQCFDEQGRLTLDLTDRMGRVVGSVLTGNNAGAITDSGMSYGDPWFMIVLQPGESEGYFYQGGAVVTKWRPAVTINGNNISWTAGVPSLLIYGVY